MPDKILVPIDNSDTSRQTVSTLIENKERLTLPVTLLHVVDTERLAYRMIPDFQVSMIREKANAAARQFLDEQGRAFAQAGIESEQRLEEGAPRSTIVHIANEEEYRLLIIGRHTMGEIRDVLFGSVANHIMHKVHCPVLLL
ncbi:MAG TPA: universal stress protein [Desulfuromonadales bacterium]|nr:universal stress protein [Desulfuromonadales bacterium]